MNSQLINKSELFSIFGSSLSKHELDVMYPFMVILGFIGFASNLFSLLLIILSKDLWTKFNFIIGLLNFSDLLYSVFYVCISMVLKIPSLMNNPIFCPLISLEAIVFFVSSNYFICCVYIYKYFHINYPLNFESMIKVKHLLLMIFILCFFSLCSFLYPFYGHIILSLDVNDPSNAVYCDGLLVFNKYSIVSFVACCVIPCIIISFYLHIRIILIARDQRNKVIDIERRFHNTDYHQSIINISKSAVFNLIAIILGLVLWVNFVVMITVEFPFFFSKRLMTSLFFSGLPPIQNPWLFIYGNKELKDAAYKLLNKIIKTFCKN